MKTNTSFKRILVPHDFSNNADNALQYAIEMAKKLSASLHILHIFDVPYTSPAEPPLWIEQAIDEQRAVLDIRLEKMCVEIRAKHKLKCTFENKMGFVADRISESAQSIHADFIVMGTQGAGAVKEVMFGTNTVSVIQKTACPLIAVPAEARFLGLKRVTYASDFHVADIKAIEQLVPLAVAFSTTIDLVHIVEDEEALTEIEEAKMDTFVKKLSKHISYKKISTSVLKGKDVLIELDNYVEISESHLLIVSTKTRNFLERLFDQSLAKELAYRTKIPLMVFHYESKEEPVYLF